MTQKDGGFLDRLISQDLAPMLKTWGFKVKGWRSNRAMGEFSHVLDFQAGRENLKGRGDFTINLGVFVPSAYAAVWGKLPPAWPRAVDCIVNRRIGEVMPNGILAPEPVRGKSRDHWWSYDTAFKLDQLAPQVMAAITDYALPFLEQFDSLAKIDTFVAGSVDSVLASPGEYLYLAALRAILGYFPAAQQLLDSAGTRFPEWHDRAQATAARLRLHTTQ